VGVVGVLVEVRAALRTQPRAVGAARQLGGKGERGTAGDFSGAEIGPVDIYRDGD